MMPIRFTYQNKPQQVQSKPIEKNYTSNSVDFIKNSIVFQPFKIIVPPQQYCSVKSARKQSNNQVENGFKQSNFGEKMSVMSKQIKYRSKKLAQSALSNGEKYKGKKIKLLMKTHSLILNKSINKNDNAQLHQSTNKKDNFIANTIPCNFFTCQQSREKPQVSDKSIKQLIKSSNESIENQESKLQPEIIISNELKHKKTQRKEQFPDCSSEFQPSPRYRIFNRQKAFSKQQKLIVEQQETLNQFDIPEVVAKSWKKILEEDLQNQEQKSNPEISDNV